MIIFAFFFFEFLTKSQQSERSEIYKYMKAKRKVHQSQIPSHPFLQWENSWMHSLAKKL